jgi:riboflavin synthase
MFTGLVERTGRVTTISGSHGDIWTLSVDPGPDFSRDHGASVAVNGVCLTEIGNSGEGLLTFQVSHETLAKTSLGDLVLGAPVNLERALRATDRLGGHIVLGHVDGTGLVDTIRHESNFVYLEILIPQPLAKYVVSKGSIAIDGTSLTINKLKDTASGCLLSFMLVPVTWSTTSLANLQLGASVNIEVDMIAKHLERLALPWKQTLDSEHRPG